RRHPREMGQVVLAIRRNRTATHHHHHRMNTLVTSSSAATAADTLHLTQISVSYEDAVRLLKIRDTYDWHQRVWQAFGGRDGAARDFLVRVDRKEEAYRVLILSRSV